MADARGIIVSPSPSQLRVFSAAWVADCHRFLCVLVLIGAAFAISTWGAAHLSGIFGDGVLLWPGTGLLTGLLLIAPRQRRAWLACAYFLSAGAAYGLCGYAPAVAIWRVAIEILQALALALLLQNNRAWVDGREDMLAAWLKFVGLGIFLVPALGAVPGGGVIGIASGVGFARGFGVWYTAHAMSICVMVPLFLRLRGRQIEQLIRQKRGAETVFWLVAFALAVCAVLAQDAVLPLFLLMPLLVMIVFRAGFVGLVMGIGLLAFLATLTLSMGRGPFLAMAPGAQWWGPYGLLQLFVLLVFGTMVLIAALLEEQRRREAALKATNLELAAIATTDALTGIPNRRWFDGEMASVWERARRDRVSVALLMIDIDHFKQYNDLYGHAAGDACLRSVSAILQHETRREDQFCARYGGEEFAVLLPGVSADHARRIGERLCLAIQSKALPHAGSSFGVVTISVGAAAARPVGEERGGLFKLSDTALYRAKASGRNRAACL